MNLKLSISLILCLTLTLVLPAQAKTMSSQSLIGQDLIKDGKKYYEKKDYPNAIHQFSKVLLVDPGNEEALEYLDRLGVKGGFYGHPNRKLSQIAELAAEVEQYQQEVTLLDEEKTRSEQLARSLKEELQKDRNSMQKVVSEKEALSWSFQEFQRQVEEQMAKNNAAIKKYESVSARQGHQIVSLNTDLYNYKDRLNEKIEELKAKDSQLKDVAQKVKSAQNEIETSKRDWREDRIAYEDKLLTIQEQLNKDKDTTTGTDVKEREDLRALRDELRKRSLELGQLRDKLIFAEYKLAHRDSQLAYQENRVKELRASLSDLEQQLPNLSPASTSGTIAGEGRFSAFPDQERAEFLKRQDRQIAELKEKLLAANHEVAKLKKGYTAGQGPDSRADLNQQIQDIQRQLREKETVLEERTSDYQVLETRFKDTQQQLRFVEKTMQEREQEIQELEEQLNRVLSQFE